MHSTTEFIKLVKQIKSGSDSCFLTDELKDEIRATGNITSIAIHTIMNGVSNVRCLAVIDLIVSSLDGENSIELPRSHTKENIPVDHSHIRKADILERLPYLNEIAIQLKEYQPQVPMGLLIGGNCSRALQPLRVVIDRDRGRVLTLC